MQELIKINQTEIDGQMVNTVNARDLYEFLGVKTRFNDWIQRRIKEYGFIEGVDYVVLKPTQNCVGIQSDSQNKVEYHVSTEGGKHIGMVENNEKGFQIRDYFIDCERRLKQVQQFDPSKISKIDLAKMLIESEE